MRRTLGWCVAGLLTLVLVCCVPAFGQVPTGTPPFGSFGGGPDVVNLANLNAHLMVPVLNKAGRGLNFSYDLAYDSSVWYPVTSGSTTSWQPVPYWGWTGQTIIPTGYYSSTTSQVVCYQGKVPVGTRTTSTNWSYTDQFAVIHPFAGQTIDNDGCPPPNTTSLNVASTDGSGYTIAVTGAGPVAITSRGGKVLNLIARGSPGSNVATDTNGNYISAPTSGVFTDTPGTTVLTVSTGAPGPTNPTTFIYVAPSGVNAVYTMKFASKTILTNFGCSGVSEYTAANVPLVSEIDLPDSTKYTFTYEVTPGTPGDVTGRLASVSLPTGGTISYAYTGSNNGIECADGSTAGLTRATPDGAWTYSRSLATSPASTTTITDPDSNHTVINFQGIYETERVINSGSATILKTIFTCYNGGTPNCNSTAITLPITNRTQYFKWPGGMESEVKQTYNSYGLATEKDEYAYGPTAPGAIVRKTLTAYSTTLTNGIVNRPSSVKVEDGSGSVKSQTTYLYDQGSVIAPTTGITTPQHNAVTGSRGNATTVTLTVGSTALTKTFTFYDTGGLHSYTDVNGGVMTFSLSSTSCGNSFATSVTEAVAGLSRSMAWNCTGGVQISTTDENGLPASAAYATDPYFWRPNSKTDAASDVTTLTYTGATEVESAMPFNSGSSTVDVLAVSDSLGRPQLSQKKQGPSASNYDSTETSYDAEGRANKATLPYVGTAGQLNSTASNTAVVYDALRRKTSVTDSGGMSATFTYTSNDVYRDLGPHPTGENDKRKQFEYDALGRLTSVCEVTSVTGSGSCAQTSPGVTGYWTTYSYDVLNNLTGVTQDAQSTGSNQTRTYAYDDLSRLTSEINPESGTTAYTYDTDSTCGTTSSGDLIKKVDQVGNITCYTYDLLHRMLSATVTGTYGGAVTPIKKFVYDSATVNSVVMTNVKGHLAEAFTCVSPCSSKKTDLGISYSALGWASNIYEMTPDSPTYYHVSQGYHPNGATATISLTGLPTITYGVDSEGRFNIVSAASGQNPLTGTTYNAASQPLTVGLGSLDSDAFTYDTMDRAMKYQFNVNGQSVVGQPAWNAIGTLASLAITDPFLSGDNQTCTYTHDDLARIASVNCGTPWSQTFNYDAFGNLSKSGTVSFQPTYSYASNHMTQIGSSTPSYDMNGNVTNDFLHTYAWDATGRPVTIDGVTVIYDALGRMVEQNKSGVITEILYTPSGAKLAIMSGASLKTGFVSLPGGSMAVYNSGGLAYYRHSDWLGSSRFASTSTRTMYSDGAYGPFGEPYAQSGATDVSFTGMNQDTVANLYDFPAREYGTQGRWPSPDPSGLISVRLTDPQSFDRYSYAGNSPMGFVDPTGMKAVPRFLGPGGAGLLEIALGLGFGSGPASGCTSDGLDASCSSVFAGLEAGSAVECPNDDCRIGTAAPFQCLDSTCGYLSGSYASNHENEVNGHLLTDAQYQSYLQTTNPQEIANQYNRLAANLDALFGDSASIDPDDPAIAGGHANFGYDCDDWSICGPGRYDNGVHIECASGGSGCAEGSALVAHDDTVSPWISPFRFSNFNLGNFLEHGFVDLIAGSVCNCVYSY